MVLADTFINGFTKYGYKQGNTFVIPPKYQEAHPFSGHIALVKLGGYYQYINKEGEVLKAINFTDAKPFSEGMAAAKCSEGWGFIDHRLNVVIPYQYANILSFSEGCAAVKKDKWSFVNKKNDKILETEFDTVVANFKNGSAIVGVKKGEWCFGVISKKGQWLVPCQYSSVKRISEILYLCSKADGYQSVVNNKGLVVLDQIENLQSKDSLFEYEKKGFHFLLDPLGKTINNSGFKSYQKGKQVPFAKWKIIDTTLKPIYVAEADSFTLMRNAIIRHLNSYVQILLPITIEEVYSSIKPIGQTNWAVQRNRKWALINQNGKPISDFEYDKIEEDLKYIKVSRNNKLGIIDSGNKIMVPIEFEYLKIVGDRFLVKQDNKVGCIYVGDSTWSRGIVGDSLSILGNNYYKIWEKGKLQIVNDSFLPISNKFFKDARSLSDTLIIALDKDSLYSLNLKTKKWKTRGEKTIGFLKDSLVLLKMDTTYGVHHLHSDSIWTFVADTIWNINNLPTRIGTKKGAYLGIANLEGKLLTSYNRSFSYIGKENNGFMEVISRRRYGFIDTNGYLLIATQYDSVKPVSGGFAGVKIKGKWGFVNRKETFVVQPNYTKVGMFKEGYAPVWTGALATLVNTIGMEQFKPRFHSIVPTNRSYWLTRKGSLYGFLDPAGKEIYTPRFSKVEEIPFGFFIVTQYEKHSIINQKLENILPNNSERIFWIKGAPFFALEEKK